MDQMETWLVRNKALQRAVAWVNEGGRPMEMETALVRLASLGNDETKFALNFSGIYHMVRHGLVKHLSVIRQAVAEQVEKQKHTAIQDTFERG